MVKGLERKKLVDSALGVLSSIFQFLGGTNTAHTIESGIDPMIVLFYSITQVINFIRTDQIYLKNW